MQSQIADKLLEKLFNYYIVFFLYFIVFGDFLFKFFPYSNFFYPVLRSIIDLFPFLFFLVLGKVYTGIYNRINSSLTITLIIIFTLTTCITTIFKSHECISSILRSGAIFRYFPLALIIANNKFIKTLKIQKHILKSLKIILAIQIIIGLIEYIGKDSIMKFFLPISINTLSSSERVIAEGSIFGTLQNTIDYAFLLLFSYSILVAFDKIKIISLYTFFTFLAIILSDSVSAMLLFAFYIYFIIKDNIKIWQQGFIFLIIISVGILNIQAIESYLKMFIEGSLHGRLGILIYTLPDFFKTNISNILFGLGTNQNYVYNILTSFHDVPTIFLWDRSVNALDDFYYASTLIYHGIIGLILLITIYYIIFKASINNILNTEKKTLLKFVFIAILFGSLFNQVLHVKTFSFLFWLIIGFLNQKKDAIISSN